MQVLICGVCYLPNMYWIGKYFVTVAFKIGFFQPSTPECEEQGQVRSDFISKLPGILASLARHQLERFDDIIHDYSINAIRIRKKLIELDYVPLGDNLNVSVSVSPRVPFLVADRDAFIKKFDERPVSRA